MPRHIGFIPDGNRRWASARSLAKEAGYAHGIAPGLALFERCSALGIEEVSVFGFTQDNTRRPSAQTQLFRAACVEGALRSAGVSRLDLVVRWGGGRRLSGLLPAQSVYADIYVVDAFWPDFEPSHLDMALAWFKQQDRTLGG